MQIIRNGALLVLRLDERHIAELLEGETEIYAGENGDPRPLPGGVMAIRLQR